MTTDPHRLATLREELRARELDGFLVPLADEHQGEYVPPRARRLRWLTGFSGSAGVAVVLQDSAYVFVDGRYTIQVGREVDTELFEHHHLIAEPLVGRLGDHLPRDARLGHDPWLHTVDAVKKLRGHCQRAGAELVACEDNPVDACWTDQPPPPQEPVVPHDERWAGKASADKRAEVGKELGEKGADAAVLTDPASIAWLLNVRGGDVSHTPLPLSFATLHSDGRVDWFVDEAKLTDATREHLDEGVAVHAPAALGPALDALGGEGRRVRYDLTTGNAWIHARLEAAGAEVLPGDDPCLVPKACKNEAELAGARAAHVRDGVAVTRFLAWLDREGFGGGQTELAAADRLEELRQEDDLYRGQSFETISGAGGNGAIIHYRVTEETSAPIAADTIYLVDAGAQYPDGTTDITRTVVIGEPTAEHRDRFTRVLQGHIALATLRFPKGTAGHQVDVLARLPLWQAGLDYDHGTGHGIGSYLGVHEGPQRVSKRLGDAPLQAGMILSNEPGYYRVGEYGIRTENLVAVVPCDAPEGGDKEMLGFETLTLAPIDRRLVDRDLLTDAEADWLNAYHARVREALAPLLDDADQAWLEAATEPV